MPGSSVHLSVVAFLVLKCFYPHTFYRRLFPDNLTDPVLAKEFSFKFSLTFLTYYRNIPIDPQQHVLVEDFCIFWSFCQYMCGGLHEKDARRGSYHFLISYLFNLLHDPNLKPEHVDNLIWVEEAARLDTVVNPVIRGLTLP